MNKILILILILVVFFSFTQSSIAETIIYDSLTPTNYKILIIDDDLNINLINDYSYDVYVNGSFLGSYAKGDKVYVPDYSNISIYVPVGNIQTDLSDIWDTGKTQFYIALMYLVSGFIFIVILIIVLRKVWSKR